MVEPAAMFPAATCVPLLVSAMYGVPATVVTFCVEELPLSQPPAPTARRR